MRKIKSWLSSTTRIFILSSLSLRNGKGDALWMESKEGAKFKDWKDGNEMKGFFWE
jgi:hypothetical protein